MGAVGGGGSGVGEGGQKWRAIFIYSFLVVREGFSAPY
jgi:hypothetical protein